MNPAVGFHPLCSYAFKNCGRKLKVPCKMYFETHSSWEKLHMRWCRVSSVCCFMLSFMHSNKPTSRWTEKEVHREKRMRHSTLSRRSDFPVRSKPPSKMRERLCKEKGTNPLLLCQLVRVARRLSCLKLDALFCAMCNHLCLHLTFGQIKPNFS